MNEKSWEFFLSLLEDSNLVSDDFIVRILNNTFNFFNLEVGVYNCCLYGLPINYNRYSDLILASDWVSIYDVEFEINDKGCNNELFVKFLYELHKNIDHNCEYIIDKQDGFVYHSILRVVIVQNT